MTLRPLLLTCLLAATAAAAREPDQPLAFTVLRDGTPIGSVDIAFRRSGHGFEVEVRTAILVRLAMIPVYRFEHQAHEVWREGRLVALSSATDDNGTRHRLTAEAAGGGLQVRGDAYGGPAPADALPASLWHPDTPRHGLLIDPGDGTLMRVAGRDLGEETVTVRGAPVPARHYRLEGDLQRDLWYDAAGTLVRVRLLGRDGSEIVWVPS